MQNLERAAVILELAHQLDERGGWSGETHLQKNAYFLQRLLGVPMGYEFILYKHGPFSFDFRDDVGRLVAHGLLDVRLHQPPYGPSLVPSQLGKRIGEGLPSVTEQYRQEVEFVAEHLGNKGAAELERLGTALFVTLEDEDLGLPERAERMAQLKPHITAQQALEALREVDAMREELPSL